MHLQFIGRFDVIIFKVEERISHLMAIFKSQQPTPVLQ